MTSESPDSSGEIVVLLSYIGWVLLYDLTALSALYKTGIPNYILHLARALSLEGESLSGLFMDGRKRLGEAETRRFVDNCLANAGPVAQKISLQKSLVSRGLGRFDRELRSAISPVVRRWRDLENARWVEQARPQLVHFTGHRVEDLYSLPCAVTICDLTVRSHRELHAEHNAKEFDRSMAQVERLIRVGRPVRLLAISDFTKQEIRKHLGESFWERTRTTLLGYDSSIFFETPTSDSQEVLRRHGLREGSYLLSVGTLEPRKNLALLLKAFESIGRKAAQMELVFVGAKGWKNERFEDRVADHPLRDRIRILNFVSDPDLAALYRSCAVFCYPSLLEGFGLPPLEAMACGAPVVLSNSSSLPEVGGEAALYCDPMDSESLVRALEQAFDERFVLREKSIARASGFSWTDCARKTKNVYRELVSGL